MKRIFHGRETLVRLPLFAILGLAIFWGVSIYLSAYGHEIGSSNMELREHIELDSKAPFVYQKYTGPQNAQALMQALDADYNKGLPKKLPKTRVIIPDDPLVIRNGEMELPKKVRTYSSDLTIREIDVRYPRAEWLQLLLDKGITIDSSDEYASLLSKRYLLVLLEDNPDLYEAGFRGIPPTDDWETYKAAYIDKLVHDHTKIQGAAAQIELGKKAVEHAKAQIEQSKEHVKLAIERSKETVERAKAQLERGAEQLEHSKAQIEHSNEQAKRAIERSKGHIERATDQLEHSKEQIKHAQKALTSQQLEQAQNQLGHAKEQLERAKKQIEYVQETLEHLKESMPPQKPTPPKEPTRP